MRHIDDPSFTRGSAWETAVEAPPTWHDQAACKGVGHDVFFPTNPRELAAALRYCNRCHVTNDCLEEGIAISDKFSVRAGMTPEQRDKQRRRRLRLIRLGRA